MAMAMCSSASASLPRYHPFSSRRRQRVVMLATESEGTNTATTTEEDSTAATTEQQQQAKLKARRFYVDKERWLDILGACLPLPLRLGTGALVQGYKVAWVSKEEIPPTRYSFLEFGGKKLLETSQLGARPQEPIQIYEFEGCPFCRKVREVASYLDLDVLYYPCPKDGPTFRPKAIELGGKKQFPYMIDPNTGVAMYESDDIIKYLVDKYGNGQVPLMLSLGFFTTLTAGLAMLGRAGKGSKYIPAKKAEKPLELWAYEPSPFCKIVREALVELELPHIYHNVARGSPKRDDLLKRTGIFQAPYLEDPNTGVKMFESADILKYLNSTYAL